jgi:hypothetical protein
VARNAAAAQSLVPLGASVADDTTDIKTTEKTDDKTPTLRKIKRGVLPTQMPI